MIATFFRLVSLLIFLFNVATLIDAQLCCDNSKFDFYFDFSAPADADRITDGKCNTFPNSTAVIQTFDSSFDVSTGGYKTIGRPESYMIATGVRAPSNAQVFNAFVRFRYHSAGKFYLKLYFNVVGGIDLRILVFLIGFSQNCFFFVFFLCPV
jgi:hypothetical protein